MFANVASQHRLAGKNKAMTRNIGGLFQRGYEGPSLAPPAQKITANDILLPLLLLHGSGFYFTGVYISRRQSSRFGAS